MARSRNREEGSIVIVVLLVLPLVFLVAGFVLDPTLLLADRGRAFAVAHAAARAGADEISPAAHRAGRLELDPGAAKAAAEQYLTHAGWSGTVTATAERVTVEVRGFGRPRLLAVFGFQGKNIRATGVAEPIRGVTEAAP